jgi:hypothetical protein
MCNEHYVCEMWHLFVSWMKSFPAPPLKFVSRKKYELQYIGLKHVNLSSCQIGTVVTTVLPPSHKMFWVKKGCELSYKIMPLVLVCLKLGTLHWLQLTVKWLMCDNYRGNILSDQYCLYFPLLFQCIYGQTTEWLWFVLWLSLQEMWYLSYKIMTLHVHMRKRMKAGGRVESLFTCCHLTTIRTRESLLNSESWTVDICW